MEFQHDIIKLRLNKNITQKQASENAGITSYSVANWESGRNDPRITIFQQYLKSYGKKMIIVDDYFNTD